MSSLTPSGKGSQQARRTSDIGLVKKASNISDDGAARRKTIGHDGAVTGMEEDKSGVPTLTPHKQRLSLGPASSYYFKYMNSTGKKKAKQADASMLSMHDDASDASSVLGIGLESILADTSVLSAGASSTSSDGYYDLMNKSTLSDPTELTASNYVLAATSRQKINKLNKSARKGEGSTGTFKFEQQQVKAALKGVKAPVDSQLTESVVEETKEEEEKKTDEMVTEQFTTSRQPLTMLSGNDTHKSPQLSIKGTSPSLRSRISASPASLRKFTQNLKNTRLQKQEDVKLRLSIGSEHRQSLGTENSVVVMHAHVDTSVLSVGHRQKLPPLTQASPATVASATAQDTKQATATPGPSPCANSNSTVSVGDIEGLFDGILNNSNESEEGVDRKTRSSVTASRSAVDQLMNFDAADTASYKVSRHSSSGSNRGVSPFKAILPAPSSVAKSMATAKSVQSKITSHKSEVDLASHKTKHSEAGTPGPVPNSIEFQSQPTPQAGMSSSDDLPGSAITTKSFSSPIADKGPSLRLTQASSHKKLTPSKLTASPRRVINPRVLDSPARNTRSSSNKKPQVGDAWSAKSLASAFGDVEKMSSRLSMAHGSETASLSGLSELLCTQPSQVVLSPDDKSVPAGREGASPYDKSTPGPPVAAGNETASISGLSGILGIRSSQESAVSKLNDEKSVASSRNSVASSLEGLSQKDESMEVDDAVSNEVRRASIGSLSATLETQNHKPFFSDTASISNTDKMESMVDESSTGASHEEQEYNDPNSSGIEGIAQNQSVTASIMGLSAIFGKGEHQGASPDAQSISEIIMVDESTGANHEEQEYNDPNSSGIEGIAQNQSVTASIMGLSAIFGKGEHQGASPDAKSMSEIIMEPATPDEKLTTAIGTDPSTPDALPNPSKVASAAKTSFLRLTPNSHRKPTPTKIQPSPGRVPNGPSAFMDSEDEVDESTGNIASLASPASRNDKATTPDARSTNTPTKKVGYAPRSPFRLKPNSHVKPTPTKLEPSPRRIPNPKTIESPARRTRSAQKAANVEAKDDTASASVMADLFGSSFDSKRSRDEDETELSDQFDTTADLTGKFSLAMGSAAKRRKSSQFQSSEEAPSLKDKECAKSPVPVRSQPIGILSSRKKRTRESSGVKLSRSVAFGSPEAAEYHIGSPSVSLTPMPSSRAKAMFAIPRGAAQNTTEDIVVPNALALKAEETVEIEIDLNMLVDNMKVDEMKGSPALSPIANLNVGDDTSQFQLGDSNYNFSMASSPGTTSLGLDTQSSDKLPSQEDETTELECGIDKLIETALNPKDNKLSPSATTAEVSSVGGISVIEGQSTSDSKPVLGKQSESMDISNFTITDDTQVESSDSDAMLSRTGEATVELEPDVNILLKKTLGNAAPSPAASRSSTNWDSLSPSESIEMTDAKSIASIHDRAEKFTADLSMAIGAQKLDFCLQSSQYQYTPTQDDGNDSMDMDEGQTVELEMDMTTLFAVAGARDADAAGKFLAAFPLTQSSNAIDEGVDGNETNMSTTRSSDCSMGEDQVDGKRLSNNNEESSTGQESQKLIIDWEDSPQASRTRRSSIASRRYTLGPASRLSLSVDGEVLVNKSEQDQSLPANPQDKNEQEEPMIERDDANKEIKPSEPVTLTGREIAEAAGVIPVEPFALHGPKASDALVCFSRSSQEIKNGAVSESLNRFVEAVCGEVESRTEAEADTYLASMMEEIPSELLLLQRSLRSGGYDSVRQEFDRLAKAVKISVESEWNSWLSNVLESLQRPIDGISSNLEEDTAVLNGASRISIEMQELVSTMTTKSVQRARRKSMMRRNYAATSLENEIRDLQSQINEAKASLEAAQSEERHADDQRSILIETTALKKDYNVHRPLAEAIQKQYLSLRGLHSWNALSLQASKMSFAFIGSSPKTSLTLTFDLGAPGSIKVAANMAPSLFQRSSRTKRVHHVSVSNYLEACVSKIVESLGQRCLDSPAQIGEQLQYLEWTIGRLEQTVNELERLRRRYQAKIVRGGRGEHYFSLTTFFSTQKTKLRVSFELSDTYPSTPLEVQMDLMEGDVDLDVLRRTLVKNTKHGHGHLSRTFDVIAAFIN